MRRAVVVFSSLLCLWLPALGQEGRVQIGLQGTGFFTQESSGRTVRQQTSQSGGFLVDFRCNLTRWISADVTYGRNRVTNRYFAAGLSRVQADAHQVTGGFALNLPFFPKLRPYLLAEGGAIVFDPTGSRFSGLPGAQRQAQGTFEYGGGVDYPVVRFLALRAEYRGLVFNSPNFNIHSLNTDAITHTAVPSAGVVLQF